MVKHHYTMQSNSDNFSNYEFNASIMFIVDLNGVIQAPIILLLFQALQLHLHQLYGTGDVINFI